MTDGEPETAVSASLQKIKSIKKQQHFFLSIFYSIKSQTSDSFVNHFDGHFAYLKTLDFSFNTASKVTGRSQIPLSDVDAKAMKRKASQIIADSAHPLHALIRRHPSGRRFRVLLAQKNSYKKSFIPSAIAVLNANLFGCRTYPGGREAYLL